MLQGRGSSLTATRKRILAFAGNTGREKGFSCRHVRAAGLSLRGATHAEVVGDVGYPRKPKLAARR